jgi:hypothetical protein
VGGLTIYGAAQLLPVSVGTPRYVALLTELALQTDTGSTITEPTFPGYMRPEIDPEDWSAPDANGAMINTVPVPLVAPPSGSVVIVQAALADASEDGNLWWIVDAFTFILDADDPSPVLPPGALQLILPWMGGP